MIKLLKAFLKLLYRIWFYILVAVPIVVCFPFLLLFSAKERLYPYFFWIVRNVWANTILYGMFFVPIIKQQQQQLEKGKSYMLIANHSSMIDIMLMLKISKNPFVFVGKKELAKIPVFGFFYKRACILVDRNSINSRSIVFRSAQRRLHQGLSICIFPEGGVSDDPSIVLDSFKEGAFRIAIMHKIPIVPIVFPDNKKRFPYTFFSGSPGKTRAQILPFITTETLTTEDVKTIKKSAFKTILKALLSYSQQ